MEYLFARIETEMTVQELLDVLVIAQRVLASPSLRAEVLAEMEGIDEAALLHNLTEVLGGTVLGEEAADD